MVGLGQLVGFVEVAWLEPSPKAPMMTVLMGVTLQGGVLHTLPGSGGKCHAHH